MMKWLTSSESFDQTGASAFVIAKNFFNSSRYRVLCHSFHPLSLLFSSISISISIIYFTPTPTRFSLFFFFFFLGFYIIFIIICFFFFYYYYYYLFFSTILKIHDERSSCLSGFNEARRPKQCSKASKSFY